MLKTSTEILKAVDDGNEVFVVAARIPDDVRAKAVAKLDAALTRVVEIQKRLAEIQSSKDAESGAYNDEVAQLCTEIDFSAVILSLTEGDAPIAVFDKSNVVAFEPWLRRHLLNKGEVRRFFEIISAQAKRAIGDADPKRAGVFMISRIHPTSEKIVPQKCLIVDIETMTDIASGDAASGHNVFVGCSTLRADLEPGKRGGSDDVVWSFALVCDDDGYKDKGTVLLNGVEPSLTVASSDVGAHHWFFFDRALPEKEAAELGKLIKGATGGDDNTGVPEHIYRVAGTPHFISKKKIEQGRDPTTIATFIVKHTGRLYTPEEIREAFKPQPKSKAKAEKKVGSGSTDFAAGLWQTEDALPKDLLKIITEGFEGEDVDRSAKFFGIVAALKRRYWTLDKIAALFEKYPDGLTAKYQGRIRAEVERVYAKIGCPFRPDLPTISIVAGEIPRIVADIEAALSQAKVPVYERAGVLVYPATETFEAGDGRETAVATLREYKQPSLHIDIARSANFVEWKLNKDSGEFEPETIDPPGQFTGYVLNNQRHWSAPLVVGIATAPLLRSDGSLLDGDQPHYDGKLRLYYVPSVQVPPITDKPTKEEAQEAFAFLLELLSEFPFVSDVDRSVALSGILTALIRPSIDVAPLHMFRATTAGSGKSYLVELASTIATGNLCAVIAVPEDEDELEKRLGAKVLKGVQIISLDNADHDIGGAVLCQLVERPRISFRILGRSEVPEYDNRAMVFCTGNNVGVIGDMTRRTLICNLDAVAERPELREFFKNPLEMVQATRGDYIGACLTIIRAYIAAGAPVMYKPLGSYAQWCHMVRGPLIWLGMADPVVSMEAARQDDPERAAIREFLTSDWFVLGRQYRSRDIIEISTRTDDLAELLERVAGDGNGKVSRERTGKWLRKISGRIVDGYKLVACGTRGGAMQYSVERHAG